MNNVTCRICGQAFEKQHHLTHHIASTHKVDVNVYVDKNFGDFQQFGWKRCSECNVPFKGRSDKCGSCFSKTHSISNQPITCRVCQQSIHPKVMWLHLKNRHNIDLQSYLTENFSDFERFGWKRCVVCGKITKSYYAKIGATCSRECSTKLRKTWTGEKAARFGAVLSDETKSKIADGNRKPNPSIRGNNNPACKSEVRAKISATRIARGVARGEKNPMFGKTHTPEAIDKIMSHRPMNRLEKMVADELDRLGIKYTFQFFITNDGVCKSYDFKLSDSDIILEVDGDFWHGNPNTKHHHINIDATRQNDILKEKMAAERGYTVVRLWESDIKKDITIVGERLKG